MIMVRDTFSAAWLKKPEERQLDGSGSGSWQRLLGCECSAVEEFSPTTSMSFFGAQVLYKMTRAFS